MVLLILALIWAAALLPPFVRSRLERSPVDSVGRFKRHLRILQRTSPVASSLASSPESSPADVMPKVWINEARRLRGMRRRRQIACCFLLSMGATFGLGLLPPLHPLLIVNFVIDAIFVGYLGLLARIRAIETEQQMLAHFARLRDEAQAEEVVSPGQVADSVF